MQQRLSSAEDKVPSKPSSPSTTSLVDYQKRTPIRIDKDFFKNQDNTFGTVSPELLGAGVITGMIALATSLSTAKSLDWR